MLDGGIDLSAGGPARSCRQSREWIGSADWDPSRRSRCQKDALGRSAVYISAKQI